VKEIAGVFGGSAVWWYSLSTGANAVRTRINSRGLGWVNKLSGIAITGFGIAALVNVI